MQQIRQANRNALSRFGKRNLNSKSWWGTKEMWRKRMVKYRIDRSWDFLPMRMRLHWCIPTLIFVQMDWLGARKEVRRSLVKAYIAFLTAAVGLCRRASEVSNQVIHEVHHIMINYCVLELWTISDTLPMSEWLINATRVAMDDLSLGTKFQRQKSAHRSAHPHQNIKAPHWPIVDLTFHYGLRFQFIYTITFKNIKERGRKQAAYRNQGSSVDVMRWAGAYHHSTRFAIRLYRNMGIQQQSKVIL